MQNRRVSCDKKEGLRGDRKTDLLNSISVF